MKVATFVTAIGLFATLPLGGAAKTQVVDDETALLKHVNEPWSGDLDGMVKRGFIRVLTTYNPLYFAYDGIEQQGLTVDVMRAFEKRLKKYLGKKGRNLHVVLMPVPRDELLKRLAEGKGDIVAANLTITPARQKLVAFSNPIYPDVRELIVTGPKAPNIASLEDLVATEIHVRRSSSYFEHVSALNLARKQQDKPEIPVRLADERLEDYDLLDMVNTGIIPAVVIDSHKAALWAQVFEDIQVHENLSVHADGSIAWAVRKNNPKLLRAVNVFVKKVRKGTLLGNILLNRYFEDTGWMDNVLSGRGQEKYRETIEIIKRYSDKYDFDWLMIAAQGFQESKLDQSARSPAGAVGIMQLLPSTAADPNVNISNIDKAENNVHAGVKYLRFLRQRYFSDTEIQPLDRVLFSFAAYNAGPRNLARARNKAAKMNFNPNKWFGHVEVAAARTISREPITYVRNIYKYYIAYKHLEEIRENRAALR